MPGEEPLVKGKTGGMQRKDRGMAALRKAFAGIKGLEVKVGFQGKSGLQRVETTDSDGKTVVADITYPDLASIHHFGTATIPERPFMGIRGDLEALRRIERVVYGNLRNGMDPVKAVSVMGVAFVAIIRKRIVDLKIPGLAESTKEQRQRKRGDTTPNPLVDTGGLVRHVTFVVAVNGQTKTQSDTSRSRPTGAP